MAKRRTPPRPDPEPVEPGRSLLDRYLLPLRLFLGGTFVYAGFQKLADPNFLSAASSGSIQAQLRAAQHSSPVGGLLGPLTHVAVGVGVLIALGELAVGIGTLLGLWSRLAAVGGLLLSLGFLLTVSWHSDPYYYGPDIVFCFAWTPLLAPPGRWSLDWMLAHREAVAGGPAVDVERRAVLARARAAGLLALPALVGTGAVAALGRTLHSASPHGSTVALGSGGTSPSTGAPSTGAPSGPTTGATPSTADPAGPTTGATPSTAAPTTAARPAGVDIGPVTAVPVGRAGSFQDPASGDPAYVVQPKTGDLKAFSAVCTHNGCTVDFSPSDQQFVCPCHGAAFDAATGQVLQGPARRPLPSIPLTVSGGQIYVDG